MKKNALESAVKLIPDLLSEFGNYIKKTSNESLKAISSNTGTIGLIVKLFGQHFIDKHYIISEQNKLKDFGIKVYLKASLIQAGLSLDSTIADIESTHSIDGLLLWLEEIITAKAEQSKKSEIILFFQPQQHPLIKEILKIIENWLKKIDINTDKIASFKKSFLDSIETQIISTFGTDTYSQHLEDIKKYILLENETQLLIDNINLDKIGFKENESLSYETTYAQWRPTSSIFNATWDESYDTSIQGQLATEKKLSKAEDLINEYFKIDSVSHLEKILFIVADFGKGKSILFKHLASSLSKTYISRDTDYLPIYFNLRNFNDFNEDHRLGVIGSFLEIRYGIKITDEYFEKKRYLFLIDSLDECGDLTSYNIDKVINSVKKVQNINTTLYKQNKIIISSRPFDDGLKKHLGNHKPYFGHNEDGRPVEYCISLYGFKVQQFNNWLSRSINSLPNLSSLEAEGFNKEILNSIINKTDYNIYENFIEKNIISHSELRRPIFSYMIFQLISNSISFDKVGKIGIYLSFLNLLTKEAKYIHDISYRINLAEQFEARNILHTTAAVWLYNRSSSNKSEIKKSDVCRALEGETLFESDQQILSRYKDSKVTEISFLSHSYFGEKDNTLHFQHQSFAEILLAEYYLKILIKFSLDEEFDFEQARIKLFIGDPTPQAIDFLKELILLLKESIEKNATEKRRLLFPLLASLATKTNNKTLYCNHLFYRWFSHYEFSENSTTYPELALKDWPIDKNALDKIVLLCRMIISSEYNLSIQSGEFKTSLFNKEVFFSPYIPRMRNIDKWISLLCGNLLFNLEKENIWFNSTLTNPVKILELLKYNDTPSWVKSCFKGIRMDGNKESIDLNLLNLINIDFSHSLLKGVNFSHSLLGNACFSDCTLQYCSFGSAQLRESNFTRTKISHYHHFALAHIEQGQHFPYCLAKIARKSINDDDVDIYHFEFAGILVNYGPDVLKINSNSDDTEIINSATFLGKLLQHGFRTKIWTQEEILDAFVFEDETFKKKFETELLFHLNDGL